MIKKAHTEKKENLRKKKRKNTKAFITNAILPSFDYRAKEFGIEIQTSHIKLYTLISID